jgi:hypothetical protein
MLRFEVGYLLTAAIVKLKRKAQFKRPLVVTTQQGDGHLVYHPVYSIIL